MSSRRQPLRLRYSRRCRWRSAWVGKVTAILSAVSGFCYFIVSSTFCQAGGFFPLSEIVGIHFMKGDKSLTSTKYQTRLIPSHRAPRLLALSFWWYGTAKSIRIFNQSKWWTSSGQTGHFYRSVSCPVRQRTGQ
jgi:hypothetical protein